MTAGMTRLPLVITLTYLLLASLWIWATQWLLGRLGGAHWEISTAGLVFGEIFVLVTGAILYALVDRLMGSRRQAAIDFDQGPPLAGRFWLTAMLLAVVVIAVMQILIVAFAARQYAPLLLDKAQREVSNLASIRAIEISNWVEERDQQVEAMAQRDGWLAEWIAEIDAGEESGFPDALRRGGVATQFQTITLLDPDRGPRLQAGSAAVVPPDMDHFDQAAVTTEVTTVTRFTRGRGGVDLFWILPLYADQTEVSRGPWFLLFWSRLSTQQLLDDSEEGFRVRAGDGLSTLLIDRPQSMHTASAFWPMVTIDPQEQSSVVTDTPAPIVSRLQSGLSAQTAGGGRSALGEGGTQIEGIDRVYATVHLERLGAQLLVLQDRRAILAPVEQLEKWLSLTAMVSTLGMFAALAFLWQYLRGRYRKRTRDMAMERDFWHQAWLDMPALGLLEIEPWGLTVRAANRQAAEQLGGARDRLVGEELFDLFEPTDPASPLAGAPKTKLPAYFARGAVDRVSLEGRVARRPAAGPMWLELRVLRDSEGRASRMVGQLRPARASDDRALIAAIDHMSALCATEPGRGREMLQESPNSPFLHVLTITVRPDEVGDRDALIAYLEAHLPEDVRHHQALLRPLADELGRVLVSGEGRWVHTHAAAASTGESAEPGSPTVIDAVGHSVVVLPERRSVMVLPEVADSMRRAGGEAVAVRLYIGRDQWEITPKLLAAIKRLHAICG